MSLDALTSVDAPTPVHTVPRTGWSPSGPGLALAPQDRDGSPDLAARLYHHACRQGAVAGVEAVASELGVAVSEVFTAVTRLVELHLLSTDETTGHLVPSPPDVAASQVVLPLERALYRRREMADRLRERIDGIASARPGPGSDGGVGFAGTVEIRGLLKQEGDVCRDELVVMRPGHCDEDLLDELFDACWSVLDRGVAVRIVCPHRSRADFASRAGARRLLDRGATIRTLTQVPQAAVVFDHGRAVMLTLPGEHAAEPTAHRVREQPVVGVLVDLFDQLWDRATPFATDEPGYADAGDDLQQSITRLMAQGLTDEVVARRLGMSVRTCRRHIAALLLSLGSVSRFQAGVQAAQRMALDGA